MFFPMIVVGIVLIVLCNQINPCISFVPHIHKIINLKKHIKTIQPFYLNSLNDEHPMMHKLQENINRILSSVQENIRNHQPNEGEQNQPLQLTFQTKVHKSFELDSKQLAIQYMSKPVSEYSLLNSSLIQRTKNHNEFLLTIPLKAFNQAIDKLFNEENVQTLNEFTLLAHIIVTSSPQHSNILMKCHNLLLLLDNDTTNHELKPWMLWGETNNPQQPTNTQSNTLSSSLSNSLTAHNTSNPLTPKEIKLSIQPDIEINMNWNQHHKTNSSFWGLDFLLPDYNKNNQPNSDKLLVRIDGNIKIHCNVPVRPIFATSFSSFPMKYFVESFGSLFLIIFLHNLSPYLIELLIEDYQFNKKK